MKNKVDDWMEALVRNYQLPKETQTQPKTVLTESQKKIILGKK